MQKGRTFEEMTCPVCGRRGRIGFVPKGGDGSVLKLLPHRHQLHGTNHLCPAGGTLVNRVPKPAEGDA